MSVEQEQIPRCDNLDGSSLRIVPAYTEAGRFCEANCVTITDGVRTAVYVPLAVNVNRDQLLEVIRLLSDRHQFPQPGFGPCVCEGHRRAEEVLNRK